MKKLLLLFLFMLSGAVSVNAQSYFQLKWEYDYTGFNSPTTLEPDKLGRPYLYAASLEQGLRFFNIDGTPLLTLDTVDLEMKVTSFTQYGNLLYVCLGAQQDAENDPPGLAIVDVTNPLVPVVKDIWIHPIVPGMNGTGIVKVEGDYAYLGAMGLGLIILNVSDPANITFVSETAFDIQYPFASASLNEDFYNARGMEVKNDIVYLCFDAGGLRIVNCVNKLAPVETGHYANPITYTPSNMPRAYNNIILNDTVAYVAVDYCGLEVLRISDTSNIILLDNFNPHNCPTGYWWESPLHFNEMVYNDDCKQLFCAGGKSEMISMDVSDPSNIDSTGIYGTLSDTTATWGIGMRNDSIYLSYIWQPFDFPPFTPFVSLWNGIKMVQWLNPCVSTDVTESEEKISRIRNYPNPFSETTRIEFELDHFSEGTIQISDVTGRIVWKKELELLKGKNAISWDGRTDKGAEVKDGLYFISLETLKQKLSGKLLKLN